MKLFQWCRRPALECIAYLVPEFGRVAFDDAPEPPTAACWREGGWVGSGNDPSLTLHFFLGPRDRDKDNRFLSRFWNNRLSTRPSYGGGRDRFTLSRSSSLSLWIARPEASYSSAHRGPPSATSRLGAATAGRVEAAAARRGRTCWITSVCSCEAGTCWAMLPVASPKRPVWNTGTLRNQTLSASLCQPDTARGGAPGPQVWTSHYPEAVS